MAGKRSAKKANDEEKLDNAMKNENGDDASENRKPKKRLRPAKTANAESDNFNKKSRRSRTSKAKVVDYSEHDYDSENDESVKKGSLKDVSSDSDEPETKKMVANKRGKAAKKVTKRESVSNSDDDKEDSSMENDEEEKPTKKRGRGTKAAKKVTERESLSNSDNDKEDSVIENDEEEEKPTRKRGRNTKAAKKVTERENLSNSDNDKEDSSVENDEEEEKPAKKRGRNTKYAAAKPKQAKKEGNFVAEKKKLTKEVRVVLEHCTS